MPANKISINKAKENKLFYIVANVVIYREEDKRCLILKRSSKEKVHPNKFAVPGGKLEWNDLNVNKPTRLNGDVLDFEDKIEDLLLREAKEETGVEIDRNIIYLNSVAYIRPDGIPTILIKFASKYLSGEVKVDYIDFTNFIWVNENEIKKYDCIKGIKKEVIQTIKIFQK